VPVAGRFQAVRSENGLIAIVDYAHTPDAVVNVLETIREVGPRRIITVVGAGGDRDKGKRPIMASEAARLSDSVILTSDNPRTEDPRAILADMEAGLTAETRPKATVIVDRREAINAAVALAEPGDVILIAGKGHEDYQEINGVKHHFDDREEAMAAFARLKQQ
ncbi:MAG: UDP-N-acetylmuramoyl-L-alanyl-D-glutamate--2,6-diaminopimelate ligase, partial [Muribaculaceae bacterium]|nr:UDP-N-acetylmuramoyl-L-alanyl-D-glutamate--2,6-diaminopimelate ligase [Muribaculaceae bacterium]